jgi:hypothetical protein
LRFRAGSGRWLNGDRRLDGGVRLVALEGEVFVLELEQLAAGGIEAHARERTRRAGERLARLLEMVQIEVRVAEREDDSPGLKPVTCATISVRSEYDAILNGTPRKRSALRW